MSRLANLIASRRSSWVVALLGMAIALGAVVGVGQAERDASALDQLPAGFESTEGQALLDELPDEGTQTAIVLFTVEDENIAERLPDLAQLLEDVAPEGAEAPGSGGGGP